MKRTTFLIALAAILLTSLTILVTRSSIAASPGTISSASDVLASWLSSAISTAKLILPSTEPPAERPNVLWMRGGHASTIGEPAYFPDGLHFVTASGDNTVKVWRTADNMVVRTIYAFNTNTLNARISSDGQTLAVMGYDRDPVNVNLHMGSIKLYDTNDWTLRRAIPIPTGATPFGFMEFSPVDPYLLAAATGNGYAVQIWNVSTGSIYRSFDSGSSYGSDFPIIMQPFAFHPNGEWIGGRAHDYGLAIVNIQDGSIVKRWVNIPTAPPWTQVGVPQNGVYGFSPDGRWVLSQRTGGDVNHPPARLTAWDFDAAVCSRNQYNGVWGCNGSGHDLLPYFGSNVNAENYAFSPDGSQLVLGGYLSDTGDAVNYVWNTSDWSLLRSYTSNPKLSTDGKRARVAFSPGGGTLLSAAEDIRKYDPATGNLQEIVSGQIGPVRSAALSANGQMAASITHLQRYASLQLYDATSGALLRSIDLSETVPGRNPRPRVLFAPDSLNVIAVIYDTAGAEIRVFDSSTGESVRTIEDSTIGLNGISFVSDASSPSEQLLAVPRGSGIRLYRLSDGTVVRDLSVSLEDAEYAFSPDGSTLVHFSGGIPRNINSVTGNLIRNFDGAANNQAIRTRPLALSPSGQFFVTGTESASNNVVRVYDINQSAPLHTISVGGTVTELTFAPDSESLVAFTADGRAKVYRTSDGAVLRDFKEEVGIFHPNAGNTQIASAAYAPDGSKIFWGRGDATVVMAANPLNVPPTHSISGQVTENGVGLSGVTITLSGNASGSTTTDSAGNYVFAGLPPNGTYTLTPTLASYTFSPASLVVSSLSTDHGDADFTAARNAHTISGSAGVANATVTLRHASSEAIVGTAVAGSGGSYSFSNVPAGDSYTLTPQLSGYVFTPGQQTIADLSSDTADVNFSASIDPNDTSLVIFRETFAAYNGGNQNALQPGTGLRLSYGGNVPGWSKSGVNSVHTVDMGGGNYAATFIYDNKITLNTPISANGAGRLYSVSFDAGPSVYATLNQATLASDGLVIKLLRGDNSVLASHTVLPGAWVTGPNAQDLAGYSFSYQGDGTGPVRFEISIVDPSIARFGGAIDNLTLRQSPIFHENFNSYENGNQNSLQPGTGLQLSFGGGVPGWIKSGFNAVHAVNLGGGNFAPNFYNNNKITTATSISVNEAGVGYFVTFDAGPSVYLILDQATLAADGLVVKLLRADNSVLASHTVLPGAWVTGPNAQDLAGYFFSYTGDGTGPVRVEISTLNPTAPRFGGAIDNLSIFGDIGGYSISGRVFADDGTTPLSGINVDLSSGASTTTNANGEYRFEPLAQGSTHTVAPANTAEFAFAPQTVSDLQSDQTVNFVASRICNYSVPSNAFVPAESGTHSVQVTASNGCAWTASSNAAWITITAGANGSGTGTVTYSVTANPTSAPRSGTLSIAGNTLTVSQGTTINVPDGDVAGLIAAINSANADPGTDTINLATRGTYMLTAPAGENSFRGAFGLPSITTSIVINGNGAQIQRSGAVGTPRFRVIDNFGGDLTLNDVVIKGGLASEPTGGIRGWGGGILNNPNSKLTMRRSTVTGNSATDGGGVVNRCATFIAENSTISHNTAVVSAGAVINHASNCASVATVSNSTIYANHVAPGGFGDAVGGAVTFKNSIIASTIRGSATECNMPMISLGYNIVSDGTCGPNGSGGDRIITGLTLGSLADNGGLTPTHALPAGSPALDHIPVSACTNAGGSAIAADQRGVPRAQNGACDIGAFESRAPIEVQDGDVAGLIAAVNAANSSPGPDVINLVSGSTYTLNAPAGTDGFRGAFGLPSITSQIIVNGNGAVIERSTTEGTPDFRVIDIFSGDLTLNQVTVRGGKASVQAGGLQGYGGGILNNNNSRLVLMSSTVTDNTASDGGGVTNRCSDLKVENSTISHNTSTSGGRGGGGVLNFGGASCMNKTTISSSTLYENRSNFPRGHSIADVFSPQPAITLKNSIVSNPTRGGAGGDCYGSPASNMPVSMGHNIFGDSSCQANGSLGDQVIANFALGSLTDNGGPTPTHALLFQSAAIDAIPSADCTNVAGEPVPTDQRGESRPKGGACDVGAYEHFDATPPVIITPGDINVPATSYDGAVVTSQVHANDAFEGEVPVTCTPSSGSSMPLGTTTVLCTAADTAGNSASASFNIYVYIPAYIISGSVGVSDAAMALRRLSDGQVVATATSGPNGSYSFGPRPPWIDYTVTPSLASHHFSPAQRTVSNLSAHQTDVDFSVTDDPNCQQGTCLIVNSSADTPDSNLNDGYCDTDLNAAGEQCTFRAAVQIANSRPAADRIVFDLKLRGETITLTSGSEMMITNNGPLTIAGPGSEHLTIDGGPGSNRILFVNRSIAAISGLKFTGGGGDGAEFPAGGAIFAFDATLTLDGVHVTGNSTTGDGGGVFIRGNFNFINSTFTNNSAANWGGAISIYPGSGSITDSIVSGNSAVIGGGIYSYPQVATNIFERVLFSGNSATSSSGGVHLLSPGGGTHKIIGSTFTANSTNGSCGAINNTITLVLLNSTISGNTSRLNGSGLCSSGAGGTTVRNSTIAFNSTTTANGLGGVHHSGGTFSFGNTIIAGNAGGSRPEISSIGGSIISEGHNLVGNSAGDAAQTGNPIAYQASDILDQDPRLTALRDNGGGTPTHAPLLNSPAFNAGSNALATDPSNGAALATDQRGTGFARIANDTVDIGAVELDSIFIVNSSSDEADANVGDSVCDVDLAMIGEQCSLRAAVQEANAAEADNTILFDTVLTGPSITLSSGAEIRVEKNGSLSIIGPGANLLAIDGGSSDNRIFYTADATVTISGLTLTGGGGVGFANDYGGAVKTGVGGALTLDAVHVSANTSLSGGGLFLRNGVHRIVNSTVSGNTAGGCGGGVHNQGALTIVNSTLSGNRSVNYYGGAVCNDGFAGTDPVVTLRNVTVVENTANRGGGIYNFDGTTNIGNTLLAANTATYPDIYLHSGVVVSAGNNLIGNSTHTGHAVTFQPSDIRDVGPQVAPLANYGGPMPTHGLLVGSPAINAGSNALAVDPSNGASLTTDQRGAGFDRVKETTVDIGAVEGSVAVYSITGQVFADDGTTSLSGITVGFPGGESVVTDSSGQFTFAGLTAGEDYTLTPQGSAVFSFTPQTAANLQSDQTINFTATRRTYSISGSVGTPNRTVTLSSGGSVVSTTVSDANGNYGFTDVQAGRDYVVTPQSDAVFSFTPTSGSVTNLQSDQILNFTPMAFLSINDVSIAEPASGSATVAFTVTLSAAAAQPVTVDVSTSDGTATSPDDYSALPIQQLVFNPGETTKQVEVSINSDAVPEINETFSVDLSNASNAAIGDGQGIGSILSQYTANGRIVFTSIRTGDWEIYAMNPDGSSGESPQRLTNHPAIDYLPSYSPDGRKIVFRSDRSGNIDIFMMNADGSSGDSPQRLTTHSAIDDFPTFSPDGRKIVFFSNRSGNNDIYVMNSDGSSGDSPQRLTTAPGNDVDPTFSPDGSKIVFTSNRNGNIDIYVMNADGSSGDSPQRLTSHPAEDSFPAFSPDGSKIVFRSVRNGNYDIYAMNADGSSGDTPQRLTTNAALDNFPSYSPDGSKIVFFSDRSGQDDIYVMNSDGSSGDSPQRLTTNGANDRYPKWQPAAIVPLSGHVFADDGATPLAGVAVNLSNGAVTTTDAGGNFSFGGLTTGMAYTVTPQNGAVYSFTPQTVSNLLPGQTLSFTATRNSYTISGSVAVGNVTVTLRDLASNEVAATAVSNSSGHYAISAAAGLNYSVTPNAEGHFFAPASQSVNNLIGDRPNVNFTVTDDPNCQQGQCLIVNSTLDAGDANLNDGMCDIDLSVPGEQCTLRAAVQIANARSANDTIAFDLHLAGSAITLTSATEILINNNGAIAIRGLGPDRLTIDGGPGSNRLFYLNNATASLSGLTLTGGNGTGLNNLPGGAIYAQLGSLTIDNAKIMGNSSNSAGGGLYASSVSLTLNAVDLTENSAASGGGGALISGGSATLDGVRVAGNTSASSSGGGVYLSVNAGTTRILNSVFSNNSAGFGGAIYAVVSGAAGPNFEMDAVQVTENAATSGAGGMYLNISGSTSTNVTVSNSSFSANTASGTSSQGGGIFLEGYNGTATLDRVTISNNTSRSFGGGLSIQLFNTFNGRIANSSIVNNIAGASGSFGYGGGIYAAGNGGTLKVGDTKITGNSSFGSGGGAYLNQTVGMTVISGSTFSSNNGSSHCGGVMVRTAWIFNSTISGNTAEYYGSGLCSWGNAHLRNVTVTNNTRTTENWGAGVYSSGTLTVGNSIIAGNTGIYPEILNQGTFTSLGNNFIGARSGDSQKTNYPITYQATDIRDQDPRLGPLADNGGPAMTHALLDGSPAANAGSNALAVDLLNEPLGTDQRGAGFGRVKFGTVDIGAFESEISVQVPSISWNPQMNTTYGMPLGPAHLNASASHNGIPVAGTFVYSPPAGTVLNAGNNLPLSVVFTPNDTVTFSEVTRTVNINVNRASTQTTFNSLSVTNASSVPLSAVVRNSDTGDFVCAGSVTFRVYKAGTQITSPTIPCTTSTNTFGGTLGLSTFGDGTYTVYAFYNPTANYNPSSGVGSFAIGSTAVLTPSLGSISPVSSADHATAPLTLTVNGSGFGANAAVLWRDPITQMKTSLAVTSRTSTQMQATVPVELLARADAYQITVDNTPANTTDGESSSQTFFVTAEPVLVTGVTSAVPNPSTNTTTATVSGSAGTVSATASTTTGTTAVGTVTLAEYQGDPVGTSATSGSATTTFSSTGGFYDVHVSSGSTYTSLSLNFCNTGGTVMYWYDGSAWKLVSPQSYSLSTRCIAVTLNNSTTSPSSPTISQLTGTVLAAAGGPELGTISITPSVPLPVGSPVNLSAAFSDPGGPENSVYRAEINWGDGTTTPAPDGAPLELTGTDAPFTATHAYNEPGVYKVTVKVTRLIDGAFGSSSHEQYVVVYDPEGGFVTGGGWINSPLGAYLHNPALVGRATFGFSAKYKKGANAPTGETQFNFHASGMNFKSESYEWLVVAGARAQFKGKGKINNTGNYGFMLTAIDGQLNGGGGTDKFRIKIWDIASGTIVYDNNRGAGDNGNPTTVLGGGSIVIHSGQ
ncbi:MAG TPA: choice-of-anchor Q domain-containing protein [Pyrinomonadaceae bacterium]|nr:choice-of-anchor Q domain-containing protein [Pyrinomonadaceae bacterium]